MSKLKCFLLIKNISNFIAVTKTYIVMLKSEASQAMSEQLRAKIQSIGGTIGHIYSTTLNGFSFSIDETNISKAPDGNQQIGLLAWLNGQDSVECVEEDQEVSIYSEKKN